MRTTITFDKDVGAAVEQLQRQKGLGVSEAVNRLIRVGLLTSEQPPAAFVQTTSPMAARIDITNVAEVLDYLESND
ncbi:MAG: CopG family transcriptional regulator [Acidimicrobiia bacterium]